MTTRIDEQHTRYLVPGIDLGTASSAELNGFESEVDSGDPPFSHLPPLMDVPSSKGWQDLLGLNQAAPIPSQIDPPPRPASYSRGGAANSVAAALRLQGSDPRNGVRASASPKVGRMMATLAAYEKEVRGIHVRASRGGKP